MKLHVGQSGVLLANEQVTQEVIVLSEHDKQARLVEILVRRTAQPHAARVIMGKQRVA